MEFASNATRMARRMNKLSTRHFQMVRTETLNFNLSLLNSYLNSIFPFPGPGKAIVHVRSFSIRYYKNQPN